MEFVVLWLLFGVAAAIIADRRGGNGCLGFGLGVLFGPFGLIFALFQGGEKKREEADILAMRKKRCPMCAEAVLAEARVCRHCGHGFDSVAKD